MQINQIRGLRKDNDRVVFVVFDDNAIRFNYHVGGDLPAISMVSLDAVAAEMTRSMGSGSESFELTTTPTDLGEAPTGELPDPLAGN